MKIATDEFNKALLVITFALLFGLGVILAAILWLPSLGWSWKLLQITWKPFIGEF